MEEKETHQKPLKIFICFSDDDYSVVNQIEKHCASLVHHKKIEVWHHKKIQPGQIVAQETKRQIEVADVILLMISISLLNTEVFFEVEKISLQRWAEKKSIVVPILIKHAYLMGFKFTQLAMLPSDREPVVKQGTNLDERCKEIAEEIHNLVETLNEITYSSFEDKTQSAIPFGNGSDVTSILYVINDPESSNPTLVNKEISAIKERLVLGKCSCRYELIPKNVNTLEEFQKALLDTNPEIVHLSSYSSEEERIVFYDFEHDKIILEPEAVCSLFDIFKDTVKLVVLNSCYSEKQANSINQAIENVIGIKGGIDKSVGLDFVKSFYQAVAYGTSYRKAYRLGRNLLQLKNIKVYDSIKLLEANNTSYSSVEN